MILVSSSECTNITLASNWFSYSLLSCVCVCVIHFMLWAESSQDNKIILKKKRRRNPKHGVNSLHETNHIWSLNGNNGMMYVNNRSRTSDPLRRGTNTEYALSHAHYIYGHKIDKGYFACRLILFWLKFNLIKLFILFFRCCYFGSGGLNGREKRFSLNWKLKLK